jgi:hypothetical protein
MKQRPFSFLLVACTASWLAGTTSAAERIQAGAWEQTLAIGGKTITRPQCISQSDADAINGDAASIRGWLEKLSLPIEKVCTIKAVKISGNTVTVTKSCPDGRESVGTTTYYGDHYETVNSVGIKSEGRRIGPCKQP